MSRCGNDKSPGFDREAFLTPLEHILPIVALTVYILDQPRVSSLQGLLLLMKCPAIPGIQNLYREQACTMALSLGLHRDPEPWSLCRSVIQLRRNIFWCCFVIDASYSLNSGSPERFPDDYITVGLPEKPSIENGDDVGEIEAENETQRIGFLIEQAKLWRIVKKIRRCGQTSNKSSESYCEGNNLYRSMETGAPSAGSKQSPSPGSAQPPWVWRADSARRILDVELAQWQMELPQNLRFDFALTRQDDPCPFLVRVNGLGGKGLTFSDGWPCSNYGCLRCTDHLLFNFFFTFS